MLKFFYRLFNHDKIDELEQRLENYRARNEQLEQEVREYKGYKLKYEVTKLYVDDDEAVLELLDAYNKIEQDKRSTNISYNDIIASRSYQQQLANRAARQACGLAMSGLAAQAQGLRYGYGLSSPFGCDL